MYYYLEGNSSPNPFDDDFSRTHPDKAPEIRVLSAEDAAAMNIDTPDEKLWGKKMAETRTIFLRKLVSSDIEKQNKHSAMHNAIHNASASTSSFQALLVKPDSKESSGEVPSLPSATLIGIALPSIIGLPLRLGVLANLTFYRSQPELSQRRRAAPPSRDNEAQGHAVYALHSTC